MDTRVVARFQYCHEAKFARTFLEMEGIESMVSNDDGGGTYPGIMSGARLIVREEDADRAIEVLSRRGDA